MSLEHARAVAPRIAGVLAAVLLAGCAADEPARTAGDDLSDAPVVADGPETFEAAPEVDASGVAATVGDSPLQTRVLKRALLGDPTVDTRGAAFGDVDGDGDDDLFVACFRAPNVLYRNEGGGEFVPSDAGSAAGDDGRTFDVVFGDLDGDGDPDLFEVNTDHQPNVVHLAEAGTFVATAAGSIEMTEADSYAGLLADLDGDGDLDGAVANRSAPNELHLNRGTGAFDALPDPAFTSGAQNSRDLAGGDLDGDGDVDLVVVNTAGEADQLFHNQGPSGDAAVVFELVRASALAGDLGRSAGCDLADVDGDGDLDLAVVARKGDPTRVYANRGDGSFERIMDAIPVDLRPSNSSAALFVDVDGENGPDLIIANRQGPTTLLINDGSGRFTADVRLDPSQAPAEATNLAASAPHADGSIEIVLTDAAGAVRHVRLGDG